MIVKMTQHSAATTAKIQHVVKTIEFFARKFKRASDLFRANPPRFQEAFSIEVAVDAIAQHRWRKRNARREGLDPPVAERLHQRRRAQFAIPPRSMQRLGHVFL